MKTPNTWRRFLALAALVLAFAGTAFAQVGTGNLFGTVTDTQGAALPGVTITVSGQGAPQVQVTDDRGQFRFVGLPPGTHQLSATLEGFSALEYPNVSINVNRNTALELNMNAAIEETITVTSESPLLDERKTNVGATYSSVELEKIPTARDPWAMIQSTPGVLTDRINVGGNESGQQSQYVGPGAQGDQSVWSIDGMVITDMAAVGSSPGYYDFDSFEEVQVGTGGTESSTMAPGVTLNIVTKRGTNEWRGSGRYFLTDESWQSDLDIDNSEFAPASIWNFGRAQPSFKQGNRIVKIVDWGLEAGGPIIKDKLWVWGSYAEPKIELLTVSDFPDVTTLEGYNAKVNAQLSQNNSATLFIWDSAKVKIGRNAGPTRPPETTWNQAGYGDWPGAGKIEDTHVFSSSFFLTGMYSIVNGGFQLRPQGGEKFSSLDGATGVWKHSFADIYPIDRPQEQFKADASNFFNTGDVSHELKYGASYRIAEQFTGSRWPAGGYEFILGGGYTYYALSRDGLIDVEGEYTSAYVQDTMTVGNLTANVGLRYDKQTGSNNAVTIPASVSDPALLRAFTFPGGDAGFTWENITPRLGVTWALGEEKQTLLRASYSQFADQLATGNIAWNNPAGYQSYTYWIGYTNNTGTFDPSQLLYLYGVSANYDPRTGGVVNSNGLDSGLEAPVTNELLLGIEHALLPEFVIGLQGTYRQTTDLLENELLVFDGSAYANLDSIGRKHRPDDYVLARTLTGVLPDGTPYATPIYELRPGVSTRRGAFLENGDREWEYLGATISATKRLSNRWMMRGNFTWSDWTWKVPDGEDENPTTGVNEGLDGQAVLQGSGTTSGAKGNVYINSTWSYSINGLYQVAPDKPWGFNVAGNITGREGYPRLYSQRSGTSWGGTQIAHRVTGDATDYRHDDIMTVDLRIEKEFTWDDFGMTLGIDCFNVMNESTVLQRQSLRGTAASSQGDYVREVMSPRVFRAGVRLSFR